MNLIFQLLVFCMINYASSTNCYYACDDCSSTTIEQECPNSDDFCYFKKTDTGIINKGCIAMNLTRSVCEDEDNTNCWFCIGDLCNNSGIVERLSSLSVIICILLKLTL